MLFDNLATCFSPLVPEDLQKIWITPGRKIYEAPTGTNYSYSSGMVDSHRHATKQKRVIVGRMDAVNTNLLRPSGFYLLSMNRQIAPLANHSDPETQLPLQSVPRRLSFKRKNDGLSLDGEVSLNVKKRRVVSKSPRNSRDAYSEPLALENSSYEIGVDRVEVIKESKDLMAGLLIKQRGNVRFRLPGTKAVRPRRSAIDFSKQKDSGTLVSYNSAFAMTGSLPRARSPLWFSQVSDCSWDNPDGTASEDSCQSTLVPTPSGSIDYTQGKTNTSFDYDCVSSSSAGLPKLLNPMLAPVSNSDKSHRNIEPEDNCKINSGSDVYSDSEEEEEEQPSAAISSEEEVERQLEVVSDSESSEFDGDRAVVYKGNRSVVQFADDMHTNRQAVELSRGINIRDPSRGEGTLCSEDGARRLLKVSIKTLLDIGSGPFQGTLLKPKTLYRGKEISFLRQV